jgi:hypothetical protein
MLTPMGSSGAFTRLAYRLGMGDRRPALCLVVRFLPVLAETLAAGPCGILTFIAGERGQPLTTEPFGNLFRAACRAAGVPGSAHGVRKIAATRAANHGATVAQLEAIFGWSGGTRWRPITQGLLIASGLPSRQCTSWRTMIERLFPHLMAGCARAARNRSEIKAEKY